MGRRSHSGTEFRVLIFESSKVVRASFRPTGNAGEFRYKVFMSRLDVPQPQAGPLKLAIDDGSNSHEGSATDCTEQRKKLVCRD